MLGHQVHQSIIAIRATRAIRGLPVKFEHEVGGAAGRTHSHKMGWNNTDQDTTRNARQHERLAILKMLWMVQLSASAAYPLPPLPQGKQISVADYYKQK